VITFFLLSVDHIQLFYMWKEPVLYQWNIHLILDFYLGRYKSKLCK
jgi:hypothetical protein